MKTKTTISERIKYRFDNIIASGTIAIIGMLALFSLLIVLIMGAVYVGFNMKDGYVESVWAAFMRTIDAGTMADDDGWSIRFISLLITIGGIFIFSTLIGTLTAGLESKLDELRKGRSKVLETDHTLILGWSPKIFYIISELVLANENRKKPRIVILAEKDKIEMEEEISSQIPDTKNTKIICRTGSPIDLVDLELASPHDARSIIILSPENDNPDIYVIKAVLALTNNPRRKATKYHIIGEIKDKSNNEVAQMVGGDEAIYINSADLIARLTTQTCRQTGLSVVYTELLDFGGDEIYFKNERALTGKTFNEAVFAYEKSAIIGIMKSDGSVHINPANDTLLDATDQLIAISEDDDTIVLSQNINKSVNNDLIVNVPAKLYEPEKNIILGWSDKALTVIGELENYVAKGSILHVIADIDDLENKIDALKPILKNQTISFTSGDIAQRATLEDVKITTYNNVIILAYQNMPIQEADARTLIALLHLRKLSEVHNCNLNIVSEMYDLKNRELAEVTRADDFIISDNLISLMLSQLSENRNLGNVFKILFSSESSEIYLRPISDYVKTGVEMNFYTVLESATQKNQIALGYRQMKHEHDHDQNYGIRLNPLKSNKVVFESDDRIIVLAEG